MPRVTGYVVCKDAFTGRWIYCLEMGDLVESDELGRRHGQFGTRRAAVAAAEARKLR